MSLTHGLAHPVLIKLILVFGIVPWIAGNEAEFKTAYFSKKQRVFLRYFFISTRTLVLAESNFQIIRPIGWDRFSNTHFQEKRVFIKLAGRQNGTVKIQLAMKY